MLRENFKALGAVVGGGLINAFKPFIKVLNAVLQKVISFAEMVTNALGSIFGWKYEASKGAGISGLADDIGSASDGMDDLSDAAGSAGKNTGVYFIPLDTFHRIDKGTGYCFSKSFKVFDVAFEFLKNRVGLN